MAKELGISVVRASYQTTIVIALNGAAPFLFIPLANVYGRRPLYLFCTLLGFATSLASAYARTFPDLLAARAFNGFMPVAFALGELIAHRMLGQASKKLIESSTGAGTVTDLFFFHQRGRAMGTYTVNTASP
jgi:MFS family permease